MIELDPRQAEAKRLGYCCLAGRTAAPGPCPWHKRGDEHLADTLRDVWDSFRGDREGFVNYLLDPALSGLRIEVGRD